MSVFNLCSNISQRNILTTQLSIIRMCGNEKSCARRVCVLRTGMRATFLLVEQKTYNWVQVDHLNGRAASRVGADNGFTSKLIQTLNSLGRKQQSGWRHPRIEEGLGLVTLWMEEGGD